jgi:hypothetical protein
MHAGNAIASAQAASRDHPLTAPLLTIAAITLGYTLQLSDGHFVPDALAWLAVALAACVAAVVAPALRAGRRQEWVLLALLGAGLAFQFFQLLQKPPGKYLVAAWPGDYRPFFLGLAVAAGLVGVGLWGVGSLRRAWFPLLLTAHFLLGVWVIGMSPQPRIDVFIFQQGGSAALLRGQNPYGLTFPDIYGNSAYYGTGLVEGDRLDFGFPYPPLSLFLALPGYLLGGDFRYAQLLALTIAGALLAAARPGRAGALAAALLLFSPRTFFVLEQGWTEPFLVLLLAATVYCACRWPRALPVALGLLLAVKQTMIFVPFLVPLLAGGAASWRDWWQLLRRAALVALVISVPLALWNLRDFIVSVVTLQLYQPMRPDALSYAAWLEWLGKPPPSWLAFVAIIPAVALALWRGARTPAGFAAGVALVYGAFFAVNKQAFCNYYFFVLGALCCAVAATQVGTSTPEAPHPQSKQIPRSGRT